MNNIQSVGNVALKNKQVPEVETKSNNLYRVNFKADGDGYRYTQPAILQQQQQDQFLRQLEKQQKKENRKNVWPKVAMFAGIGASIAMIALVLMNFKGMKGVDVKDMLVNSIRNVDGEKSLDQLRLPDELKKVTEEIKIMFDRTEQLRKKGMKGNTAIMLYGEPGGGKNAYTYGLTKYIQSKNPGSELIMMDVLKFNSKWLGETENSILDFAEEIIKKAKENPNKKYVVFMDEFDSISRKATGSGAESSEKFQNAFKTAFNKLLEVENLQIIAATNRAAKDAPLNQLLDEAILNRFAKKVHGPLPTKDQFKNSLVEHYKSLPKDVVDAELLDINNSTLDKISQYVTNNNHHASFRDMNYILDRARTLSESEATSRPISIKDLLQAVKDHAESMNWTDVLN